MKGKTLYIVIGIVVIAIIAYIVYNRVIRVKNAPNPPMPNSSLGRTMYPPQGTGAVCSPDSYICGITGSGLPICCPIPPSGQKIKLVCPAGQTLVGNSKGEFKCAGNGLPDSDPTVVVVTSRIKSAEQEFCERHGGKWNGTSCTAFTEEQVQRTVSFNSYNPNSNHGGMNGNPAANG